MGPKLDAQLDLGLVPVREVSDSDQDIPGEGHSKPC